MNRWFCESTFGKLCEDKLRRTLADLGLLVKSVNCNDKEFLAEIEEYVNSDKSRQLQRVLFPTSTDASTVAHDKDIITESDMMKGSYVFEHHVRDDYSELLDLKHEDGAWRMKEIVITYFLLLI